MISACQSTDDPSPTYPDAGDDTLPAEREGGPRGPGMQSGITVDGGGSWAITDEACERINASSVQAPNVLIVLDRSKSMYVQAIDRWTPAVAAVRSLVESLENQVRFGLMTFPGRAGQCDAGELRVSVGLGRASEIVSALDGPPESQVGGGTPTAETLTYAASLLSGEPGTSYVVLVTDGAPNCNAQLDAVSCTCTGPADTYCRGGDLGGGAVVLPDPRACLDDADTLAEVEALRSAGVRTYVIGYDTPEWGSTLDALAVAGDTGVQSHFAVSNGSGLLQALDVVGSRVASCEYEMGEAPTDYRHVRVSVDGEMIPHESIANTDSAWTLIGARTVRLLGQACTRLADGQSHDVDIVRECEPIVR